MSGDLQEAISLIKSGHKEEGKTILIQILEEDPQNDKAWIWMSAVVDTDEMRLECLEEALKINPNNNAAQKGVTKLRENLAQQAPVIKDEFDADDGWYDPIEPEPAAEAPIGTYKETYSYENYAPKPDPEFTPKSPVKTPRKKSILVQSPWITIWYMPRITIRAILDTDPNKDVLLIASLFGLLGMFFGMMGFMLTDITYLIIGMIMTLILGPIIGIVWLYIVGAVLSWTGFFLAGKGTAREVRTALAWGNIPMLTTYIILIPLMFLLTFVPEPTDAGVGLLGCMAIIAVPLNLYGFYYIFLQSLAEAHQFSGWRALGTVMLPGILISCAIWIAVFVSAIGMR